MIHKILNSRSKTVAFSAFVLAFSGFISRFLGLLRDRLLAGHFGAGSELDIYFAAFRIPDFVYTVLIAGGLTAAFLPIFAEYYKSDKGKWDEEVTIFANNLLNAIFVCLIIICAGLALFAPYIVKLIVPGFSAEQRELAINLTRIMFLSPIFFGLSSIFSGILQYFDKFLIYSLCPIFYNVGIIIGIIFFVPVFGIYGLGYGVILGAFLYFVIQIPPAIHSGFKYKPLFDFRHEGIRKIFKLTLPRLIGTATDQLNLIILTAIASVLSSGSIAIFSFANNLQYFPIGIIGISFAVSSFPVFSKFLANGQKKEFFDNFSLTFRQILYFIIPTSLLLFLLRAQAVRLILGTGEFGWRDTRLTAAAVGLFCFGIVANSIIPLLTKAFFAAKDTKTPVVIAMISTSLSIILSLFFVILLGYHNLLSTFISDFLVLGGIGDIKILAIPLAMSIVSGLQLVLLLLFLHRKIGDFRFDEIMKSLSKIVIASVGMFVVAYFVRQESGGSVDMQTFTGVFFQTFLTSVIAFFVYLLLTLLLKSPELGTFKKSVIAQIKKSDLGAN